MGEGQAEREWQNEGQGRRQSKLSYQICLAGKLRRSFPNATVGGASQARGAGADRERKRERGGARRRGVTASSVARQISFGKSL